MSTPRSRAWSRTFSTSCSKPNSGVWTPMTVRPCSRRTSRPRPGRTAGCAASSRRCTSRSRRATTRPRRPSGVSGSELSHPVAPSKDGRLALDRQLGPVVRQPMGNRPDHGSELAGVGNADHDLPPGVAVVDPLQRIHDLPQRIAPVDHRPHLPRRDQLLDAARCPADASASTRASGPFAARSSPSSIPPRMPPRIAGRCRPASRTRRPDAKRGAPRRSSSANRCRGSSPTAPRRRVVDRW